MMQRQRKLFNAPCVSKIGPN